MITKILVFEVGGVRSTIPKSYKEEPTKEQVLNDMKEWFFENHYMWFAVKENGIETSIEEWFSNDTLTEEKLDELIEYVYNDGNELINKKLESDS